MPQLPGALRHFHQEAILHQLPRLREMHTRPPAQGGSAQGPAGTRGTIQPGGGLQGGAAVPGGHMDLGLNLDSATSQLRSRGVPGPLLTLVKLRDDDGSP